ncbi:MAG: hypothetical protein HY897_16190 [Deltaproteobacteria bacterium]|nr:hypothetical protein [Deltaproteobacteria bacterium]
MSGQIRSLFVVAVVGGVPSCGSVALPVEVTTNYQIDSAAIIEDIEGDLGPVGSIPAVWPSPPFPQVVKDVAFAVTSDVSLADNTDVGALEGRISEIRLDWIGYEFLENSLNKRVSAFDLTIGAKGTPGDAVVARLGALEPGEKKAGRAALDPSGRLEAAKYLDILEFACGMAVTVPIDTLLDPAKPEGGVKLRVTLGLVVAGGAI